MVVSVGSPTSPRSKLPIAPVGAIETGTTAATPTTFAGNDPGRDPEAAVTEPVEPGAREREQ
nr:hypothetical protein [Halobaculum sp. SYNS20]